jgi:hypothetical protein
VKSPKWRLDAQPSDNSMALAAFIARKTEIDIILARLTALSGEHFNTAPDEVTWGHVGTLGNTWSNCAK